MNTVTPVGLASLGAMSLFTLWRALGGPSTLFAGIAASAVALLVAERRHIPANLRTTAALLIAGGLAVLPFANRPLEAVARGVLVGGLLASLMAAMALLGRCAMRSRRVHEIGEYLRALPGRRRYLGFALASQLFSGMLSLAGANLLYIMAAHGKSGREAAPLVVAVTRGFSAATFWSPVFGNMAILLALYPTLHWVDVFPLGFALAQATVLIGFLMYRGGAEPDAPAARPDGRRLAAALAPLLAVLAAFLGMLLLASAWLGITISAAIVLLAPFAAWILNTSRSSGPGRALAGVRHTAQDLRRLPSLAAEAAVLMSASCAGTIMASAFPDRWAELIGAAVGGTPILGIGALVLALLALSLAGIHPVLSAVFLASMFTPSLLNLPTGVHFSTILMAWGLAASISPFSMLTMTASRYSGLGLYRVSLGENWRYVAVCAAVFTAGLAAFVAWSR